MGLSFDKASPRRKRNWCTPPQLAFVLVLAVLGAGIITGIIAGTQRRPEAGPVVTLQAMPPGHTPMSLYFVEVTRHRTLIVYESRSGRVWKADLWDGSKIMLRPIPYESMEKVVEVSR